MGISFFLVRGLLVLVIGTALVVYIVASLHDRGQRGGNAELQSQAQNLLRQQVDGSPYELAGFRLSQRTREDSFHILGEVRWRDEPARTAPFVAVLVQLCEAREREDCWRLRRFEVVSEMTQVARAPIMDETTDEPEAGVGVADLGQPLASGPLEVMGSRREATGDDDQASLAFGPAREIAGAKTAGRQGDGPQRGIFGPTDDVDGGHALEHVPKTQAEKATSDAPQSAAIAGAPQPDWRISANRVNVRAGPGMDHDVLATLGRDTPIRLEESAGGWGRFSWQDGDTRRQGWIFLDLAAPAASDL